MTVLFFDIETVYDSEHKQDESSLFEKYGDKCDFMPELNKILTICCGTKTKDGLFIKNLEGTEKEQITKFFETIHKYDNLCGFNIMNFDLPFIVKRALYYGIKIPDMVKFFGKKPWELTHLIDLQDVYKMNVWGGIGNLDLISHHLGVDSPKDKMSGREVQDYHEQGRDDEIIEYCKKDVKATIEVYDKLLELNMI